MKTREFRELSDFSKETEPVLVSVPGWGTKIVQTAWSAHKRSPSTWSSLDPLLRNTGFSAETKRLICNVMSGMTLLGLFCQVPHARALSCVWLFATPRTVAHQAPLSTGFPKQIHWSGLPSPSAGDLPYPNSCLLHGKWVLCLLSQQESILA